VQAIAEAVLYEGHVLWPYRPSALKNRQRWTFGGVYPESYARSSGDRSQVHGEFLVEGEAPQVDVEVRFLQLVHCVRDGTAWEEAVERHAGPGWVELPAGRSEEPPLVRTWEPLEGRVDVRCVQLRDDLHRVSVAIANTSDWAGAEREGAMARTLASAHAVACVEGGAFVSAVDPPEELRAETEACRSDGLWPVLVGEPGDRTTLLASPIILYDYPEVAPESPGDFFDGCEIDQLLVLSILGLSDGEKDEIRAGDPRARAILERTEAMTPDEIMRLHGTWRRP